MFDYKEYFSNLSCYEEYCLKCTLLGKDKSDKDILNCLGNNENYYYFIDNNGKVVWLDDKGNKVIYPNIFNIEERAFYGCKSLTSIIIPKSVKKIGYYSFYYCESLTSISIPNSVTKIKTYAFYNCNSLKSINIPDSVTVIGHGAFSYCEFLKSINIPNSVKKIGNFAFYRTSLKEIIISKKCKIEDNSFPKDCKIIRR